MLHELMMFGEKQSRAVFWQSFFFERSESIERTATFALSFYETLKHSAEAKPYLRKERYAPFL